MVKTAKIWRFEKNPRFLQKTKKKTQIFILRSFAHEVEIKETIFNGLIIIHEAAVKWSRNCQKQSWNDREHVCLSLRYLTVIHGTRGWSIKMLSMFKNMSSIDQTRKTLSHVIYHYINLLPVNSNTSWWIN